MNINNIKKIHFIGIGGIGVSAIAKMMLGEEKEVSGSDLEDSEIVQDLKKRGAKIFVGHKAENVSQDADLVVYSPAVSGENIERQRAGELGIPELSYPGVLGEISKDKFTIAVSGTNGKSTTTAILGLILEAAGLDPTVIVGSKVKNLPEGNFRLGKSKYFVVEGCEHRAHMLNLHPNIIVLTNIEADHLDFYKDLESITENFKKYVKSLPKDGLLILNVDDPVSKKNIKASHCQTMTYGIKNKADLMAENIKVKPSKQIFDLKFQDNIYSGVSLKVPGEFNIYNTLAASTAALNLKVKPEVIKKTLVEYSGIWRRFEKLGERGGAIIISDYAHHPTAVRETLKAARQFYPQHRIVAVFQPHQHNRTKKLFNDFVRSFDQADLVILSGIYDVAGREEAGDQDISSKDLARDLDKQGKRVFCAEDLSETKKIILENIQKGDLVLIMGAGDIYKVANELVNDNFRVVS